MITDGTNNWHYLAVKSISRLTRGIKSNHNGDFVCLNYFHSYTTKEKLKKHERICKDHDFYYPKMPDEDNKFLKYIYGAKSLKVPFIIYADMKIINHEKKELISLTNEEKETHENQKICNICEKEFCTNKNKKEF